MSLNGAIPNVNRWSIVACFSCACCQNKSLGAKNHLDIRSHLKVGGTFPFRSEGDSGERANQLLFFEVLVDQETIHWIVHENSGSFSIGWQPQIRAN
jgi:hypothetical protein